MQLFELGLTYDCRLAGSLIFRLIVPVLIVLRQIHTIFVVAVQLLQMQAAAVGTVRAGRGYAAAATAASRWCSCSSCRCRTAFGLIGPAPFGATILEPSFHLAIRELQLQRQMTTLLWRKVLGAGETILQVFCLLRCKAYLAALSLHAEIGHVETCSRICRIAVESRRSSCRITEAWRRKNGRKQSLRLMLEYL